MPTTSAACCGLPSSPPRAKQRIRTCARSRTRRSARAVAKQEAIGLQSITDGEFRRDYWHLDFMRELDGVTLKAAVGLTFAAEDVPPMATVTGKVRCTKPVMVDHFAFLKSATRRTAKFCMPSPGSLHFRGGRNAISREVYPDLEEFWADAGAAWREAIRRLGEAGCTYLQIDDVGFSYLCDAKVRENFRANGDDPAGLQFTYAAAINRALEGRPKGMTVTMHTCRGNFRSTWFASGGYQDEVLEGMFSAGVDGFFMEYDSERAGGFEPLRRLPKGKMRGARPGDHEVGRARVEGRAEAAHRRGFEVRAAREPAPVAAMRFLEHAPRQQAHRGRAVAQARAGGRGRARSLGLSLQATQNDKRDQAERGHRDHRGRAQPCTPVDSLDGIHGPRATPLPAR